MKVVVIDEWLPLPLDSGKKIRTYNIISRLARRHDIAYIGYVKSPGDESKIRALEDIGIRVVPVPDSRARKGSIGYYCNIATSLLSGKAFSTTYYVRREYIRELLSVLVRFSPDLVHCEWTNLAPFLEYVNSIPTVICAHNIESVIWERLAKNNRNPFVRLVASVQAQRIEQLERQWYPRVTSCIAVSESDRRVIETYGGNATVVDNGVDVAHYRGFQQCSAVNRNRLQFVASFDTFANQDAFEYFVKEIFPLILVRRPDAEFVAVGRSPSARMRAVAKSHRSVYLTGWVRDVRPHIASSVVSIVPLRIGGGSRLKILESMAMGKPVVSTSIGAEGLDVENGRNIVIADTPGEFANEVLALLDDERRLNSLSAEGLRLVMSKYDWDVLAEKQDAVWRKCVNPVAS